MEHARILFVDDEPNITNEDGDSDVESLLREIEMEMSHVPWDVQSEEITGGGVSHRRTGLWAVDQGTSGGLQGRP